LQLWLATTAAENYFAEAELNKLSFRFLLPMHKRDGRPLSASMDAGRGQTGWQISNPRLQCANELA
jgi:hypothetical protein